MKIREKIHAGEGKERKDPKEKNGEIKKEIGNSREESRNQVNEVEAVCERIVVVLTLVNLIEEKRPHNTSSKGGK